MAISPWSRGGYVVSQLFDHTSAVRFIEKVLNVSVPTISPWRRAMMGDLLSAFNFSSPDYDVSWVSQLPDTSAYPAESIKECDSLPPPRVPAQQTLPIQEPGTRPSRALPYALITAAACSSSSGGGGGLILSLDNSRASAGIPVLVYDYSSGSNSPIPAPRKYAIEAGKVLNTSMPWPSPYALTLHAPNGYARSFAGECGGAATSSVSAAEATIGWVTSTRVLSVHLASGYTYNITDMAYGSGGPWIVTAPAGGGGMEWVWEKAAASGYWYDFFITLVGEATTWSRRAMGRMETGFELLSDPAGPGAPLLHEFQHPKAHPDVPEQYRQVPRNPGQDKDAMTQAQWEIHSKNI